MITLECLRKGQLAKIIAIPSEVVRAQAIRFGIAEGAVVECQEVLPAGPVVLRKQKQEIAVGRNLARAIQVEVMV